MHYSINDTIYYDMYMATEVRDRVASGSSLLHFPVSLLQLLCNRLLSNRPPG